MHSIKLRINDRVIDKVLYFLESLPKDEVEIVEDSLVPSPQKSAMLLSAVSLQTSGYKFDREEASSPSIMKGEANE